MANEDQIPYTPAGREAFLKRDAADDPTAYCLPPGMPRMLHSPFPMLIMQSPGLVTELFEYQKIWRLIYTDGRPHHTDVTDTFMGDSIGHWERKHAGPRRYVLGSMTGAGRTRRVISIRPIFISSNGSAARRRTLYTMKSL